MNGVASRLHTFTRDEERNGRAGPGSMHTLGAGDDGTALVWTLLHSAVLADGFAEGTHLRVQEHTPGSDREFSAACLSVLYRRSVLCFHYVVLRLM